MDLEKLNLTIGQKVFVVFKENDTRKSVYGSLDSVEPNTIMVRTSFCTLLGVPINRNCKILKVYNEQGLVVYDGELEEG